MILSPASPPPPPALDRLHGHRRQLSPRRRKAESQSSDSHIAPFTSSRDDVNSAHGYGTTTCDDGGSDVVRGRLRRQPNRVSVIEDEEGDVGRDSESNETVIAVEPSKEDGHSTLNGGANETDSNTSSASPVILSESSAAAAAGLGLVLDHSRDASNGASNTSLVDVLKGSEVANALKKLVDAHGLTGHEHEHEHRDGDGDHHHVLKLSSERIQELIASPESIPYRTARSEGVDGGALGVDDGRGLLDASPDITATVETKSPSSQERHVDEATEFASPVPVRQQQGWTSGSHHRPQATRAVSTPGSSRKQHTALFTTERPSQTWTARVKLDRQPSRLDPDTKGRLEPSPQIPERQSSPAPQTIPLPPVSLPTYLQLELASGRPSPLYIHGSVSSDFPYESSRVKLERLVNFLTLPFALERVLWFGALACLDSWLYSFTILPLRFLKAIYILVESWVVNLIAEVKFVSWFIFTGIGRVWRRTVRSSRVSPSSEQTRADIVARSRGASEVNVPDGTAAGETLSRARPTETGKRHRRSGTFRHRRQKSIPSALLPDDKADILKGLLMIATCWVLMYFDASRMYHWIRGQAAIKLYVIYNVLEVSDRLFAAIGQDVLECLFSREALERKPDGRSKVLRPFWLFLLALVYTVIHATALFYQVMTLNVAVNSYSNALITLLLSNQFVEIKSTVFKKFEKENLFQLTCADVVERFQLWLMLTMIASRNIVETGTFNFFSGLGSLGAGKNLATNASGAPVSTPPRSASSIVPQAFTMFPTYLLAPFSTANSFLPTVAQVMGPFLVVLGSEMLVDWLKHAYIGKFNNTRPKMYGRFLDVLAKDYYTNAFADQNLTKRVGLPVIPLSCLFFRVSVQTYQMFLATWIPQHPSSTAVEATSLASIHSQYVPSPVPSAIPVTLRTVIPTSIAHVGALFQTLLENAIPSTTQSVHIFTIILLLTGFVVLLILKLLLGMLLLTLARSRYKRIIRSETASASTGTGSVSATATAATTASSAGTGTGAGTGAGANAPIVPAPRTTTAQDYAIEGSRRFGGWGVVEVDDDKRRWIYADDPDGLRRLKEKEKGKDRGGSGGGKESGISMEAVMRYEMVAKRIW